MNVVGHDDVFAEVEFSGIAVLQERGDHEVGDLSTLEEVPLHVRTNRYEVSRHVDDGAKAPRISNDLLDANLTVRSTWSVFSPLHHVIKDETYQPGHHHQGVPLHQSPLQQAHRIRCHACQNRRPVDTNSVDNPLVPPG